MAINSKDIGAPFIISLMINTLATYFFYSQKISFNNLIVVFIGSLIVIIIIGIQLKVSEIEEELSLQKTKQKDLNEKLKIYERLSKIEAEMKLHDKKK